LIPLWLILTGSAIAQGDKQIQIMYVRPNGAPDNSQTFASHIRAVALAADALFDLSAHKTGGHRHIKFVLDQAGQIDVMAVELPPAGTIPQTMAQTMKALGYADPNRKYVLFVEAEHLGSCGYATHYVDSRPGPENLNNVLTGHAVMGFGCWNVHTMAHEVVHLLGGVQPNAPHGTWGRHCTDEHDIMCFSDPPFYPRVTYPCPMGEGSLLDCGNDDYYHTDPEPGTYLASRWNVANSEYLSSDEMQTYLPMVMQ
jgi:hypothetical protein